MANVINMKYTIQVVVFTPISALCL